MDGLIVAPNHGSDALRRMRRSLKRYHVETWLARAPDAYLVWLDVGEVVAAKREPLAFGDPAGVGRFFAWLHANYPGAYQWRVYADDDDTTAMLTTAAQAWGRA